MAAPVTIKLRRNGQIGANSLRERDNDNINNQFEGPILKRPAEQVWRAH